MTEPSSLSPEEVMNENAQVELDLEIVVADATDEELDRATRQLLSEIRELNVQSARLAKGESAPDGSKGDPITVGTIALEVLPVAIPSLITLVQAWAMRGQGKTVKFKGKGIEFEGSPEDLQKLLATLDKRKKKK
jgi:hypothetical protein